MKSKIILVIEDEESILELITYNLEREGFRVIGVSSGEAGLLRARESNPGLIILDLMLPGIDGIEVCSKIRGDSSLKSVPIVMISAKGEEPDIVRGLELGADDYVTKPFSPTVLVARVKAVLRRKEEKLPDDSAILFKAGISIDPRRFVVKLGENNIDLTLSEFRLLHFLMRHPGWVFTRYQIVDAIKGEDYPVTDRSVDVQIVGLRKKLGEQGKLVETVRGVGYRFKE
ncbi:MAG: response regulator [Deltaproteobacteria bacterium]|nr:response regulator [Deltaproteobacteria bacterium]